MHLQNRVSGHGVAAHTYGHLCTHDISESQIDGKAWKSLFDARGAIALLCDAAKRGWRCKHITAAVASQSALSTFESTD